jgi:hypothetical protein
MYGSSLAAAPGALRPMTVNGVNTPFSPKPRWQSSSQKVGSVSDAVPGL